MLSDRCEGVLSDWCEGGVLSDWCEGVLSDWSEGCCRCASFLGRLRCRWSQCDCTAELGSEDSCLGKVCNNCR